MRPSGSPNTVAASSNGTPCFARFLAAFCGSHSNLSATAYYTYVGIPLSLSALYFDCSSLYPAKYSHKAR